MMSTDALFPNPQCTIQPLDWPEPVREFLDVCDAMSKLNSWARTSQCEWTCRYVIYWLKGEALKHANRLGLASHRMIGADVQCRDCDGSRHYVDQYGYKHDHCRACSSTGTARLAFLESTICGRLKWHTPRHKAFEISRLSCDTPVALIPVETNWQPNAVGLELSPDEAARLLIIVEDGIPHGKYPNRYLWELETDADDFADYKLNLGNTTGQVCRVCDGSADYAHWLGISFGRLRWSEKVCQYCYEAQGINIFQACVLRGVPQALFTPNVKEWARRHHVCF